MTNYEKFKGRLDKFGACGIKWGVKNGEPVWCDYHLECGECELNTEDSCYEKRFEWLDKEYKEPDIDWSKVPVDAKVLVSYDGIKWRNRHFAEFKDGRVWTFKYGSTSWSTDHYHLSAWENFKLAEEEIE